MDTTLAEIASLVDGQLHGDAARIISTIAPLDSAGPQAISFLSSARYSEHLRQTAAGAVLLHSEFADECAVDCIVVADPYLAYAKISALFDDRPKTSAGVHDTAVIGHAVEVGADVVIGPNCVVGDGARIGAGTILGASCTIGDGTVLGQGCRLAAQVVLYHKLILGDRVEVHSGSVIGADGFGFAPSKQGWQKIHQIGTVRIGNDVSIGANTCIDRGAIDDTVIGNDVIIDNQVQIAHNVVIGNNTALAGCVGIAGSAKIGAYCTLGGGVGVAGHLTICDNVHLTGMTLVSTSITKPGTYSSGTALSDTRSWRKNAVRFLQLDKLYKRVAQLEKRLPADRINKD